MVSDLDNYANGFELQTSTQTKVCGIDRKWMEVFYSTKIFFIGNFLDPEIDGSQILPDVAKCSISGLPRWTVWRKDDDDNCSIQSIPNFCCVQQI